MVGDPAPLRLGTLGIVLGKGGGDEGGDDAPTLLAGEGQDIPHKMNPAPLPVALGTLATAALIPPCASEITRFTHPSEHERPDRGRQSGLWRGMVARRCRSRHPS
jgi:hypothetical protein